MTNAQEQRPPFPPFTEETAAQKVRLAEDAWNTRDSERVSLAYTTDSEWRNRAEFFSGRAEIARFLERKWARELEYRLVKELWAFEGNGIAALRLRVSRPLRRLVSRLRQRELEFDEYGLMRRRLASINDLPIDERERKYHWPHGSRPVDHPGLSELGL